MVETETEQTHWRLAEVVSNLVHLLKYYTKSTSLRYLY